MSLATFGLVLTLIPAAPPLAEKLATEVSPQRVKEYVEKLESFGTRHTLSDAVSETRGIGAARRWLRDQLVSFGGADSGYSATIEEFNAPKSQRMPTGGVVANVVAVLPGSMPEARRRAYYVVGHYDSRNGEAMDATTDAPGANDDASGTAVVLECARILAQRPLEATVVFLCVAGEEQGLVGSRLHAGKIGADKPYDILGVLSNDIVGDPSPGGVEEGRRLIRVFSEGIPRNPGAEQLAAIRTNAAESDSTSRQLARFVAACSGSAVTPIKPMLVFRPDRFLRGGDHSSFNEAGFAAVRFTTLTEDYSRQHQGVSMRDGKRYGDVSAFVDSEYLAGVTRLNLVTLINLANAPSPPAKARILTRELATDTSLKWEPGPEPDIAGYEVVYRRTTSPDWETVVDVGQKTEHRLDISKDNVFFGVRSYDKDGYRSPVSFAWASRD
jgi:hypothetical protein